MTTRAGVLSGKIKPGEVPKEGRFSDTAKSGAMYRSVSTRSSPSTHFLRRRALRVSRSTDRRQRYFKDATFDALKIIEPVVEKHNLTLIEVAFRWLVHHSQLKLANKGGNDGILIGVSSQEQLENNLEHLEKGPLPEEVCKALDEAWKVIGGTAPNYYHLKNEYAYDTIEALYGEGAL
jgi:aflatoxin B1 aldehyde reductase